MYPPVKPSASLLGNAGQSMRRPRVFVPPLRSERRAEGDGVNRTIEINTERMAQRLRETANRNRANRRLDAQDPNHPGHDPGRPVPANERG